MSSLHNRPQSIHYIRSRLLWLLILSLGGMLSVIIFLWLLLLIFVINQAPSSRNPFVPHELQDALQIYYRARGSWENVAEEFNLAGSTGSEMSFSDQWEDVILINEDHRVLLDRGYVDTELVGKQYTIDEDDTVYPIFANGNQVGYMILTKSLPPKFVILSAILLPPVLLLACFLGILTFIIGLLLMQRVVTPLSDVMVTAQEVAAGDLSARVQVRGVSDIRTLSDSFNQMADSLERNDQERRNMLADVAHELRTPLTILRGRLEGILDGVYPVTEEQIAPALAEVYLLDNLVEDLRLLTLTETRQLLLNCQDVNLGEIAKYTASLFEAEAASKKISFITNIESDLPLVNADPQRMGQVIGNLLSNAIRYTLENGQIILKVERIAEHICLSVSDNGSGIDEAELSYVFDRFWRAEKSRTRTVGGAGLGLTIARQLVEMHGGTIGVESQPGKGSRFWFTVNV